MSKYQDNLEKMVEEVKGLPYGSKEEIIWNIKTDDMRSRFCWTENEFSNLGDDEVSIDICKDDIEYLFDEYNEEDVDYEIKEMISNQLQVAKEQKLYYEDYC